MAYKDAIGYNIMLFIEAKAYSGWTTKQLRHKARRLVAIFGPRGNDWPVRPQFILAGPKKPAGVTTDGWPAWTKDYAFLKMPSPVVDNGKSLGARQRGSP